MELSAETQNALNEFLRDRQVSASSQADGRVDDDVEMEQIQVGNFSFEVKIPEAEWNAEKKTLFATMVWNGARSLGNYLIQNARDKVIDRRVLEFGAGVGIPSLVCNALGATFVCVSDYPTEHILSVIQQNICLNARNQSEDRRMDVVGYKWGTSVESLLEKNNNQLYDLVIASECLWRHEQHDELLTSISATLSPRGTAILAFSHHVPGKEQDDLAFFTLATSKYGLSVTNISSGKCQHMWSDRLVDMLIYELQKVQS